MDFNLNHYTMIELRQIARQQGLTGYTRLRKEELVGLLNSRKQTESTISKDIQYEILLRSNPKEISKICATSKETQQLCRNEHLWQGKVGNDFGQLNKPKQLTWYQYYQQLYRCPQISNTIESLHSFWISENNRTDLAEQIERHWVGETKSMIGLGVDIYWNTRKISFKTPLLERKDIFFIRFSLDGGTGSHSIHVEPDLTYSIYRHGYRINNNNSFKTIETLLDDYIKICLPLKYPEFIAKQQKWFREEPRNQLNGKTPEEAVTILKSLGW